MSSLPQVEIPARHIRAFMMLVLRFKTSQLLYTSKTMQPVNVHGCVYTHVRIYYIGRKTPMVVSYVV